MIRSLVIPLVMGCLAAIHIPSSHLKAERMPHKNQRLCSQGLILKQKQTKTIEWLIQWQNHLKQCPLCKKRNGQEAQECPICHEPYNTIAEVLNLKGEKTGERQVIPIILPIQKDNYDKDCCGHSVCKHCLIEWFSRERVRMCPVCRTKPGADFINETLGLGSYNERNLPYLINVSCLLAIITAEGFLAGITLGVVARKMLKAPTYHQADPQTVFALHYLALLATWVATHQLIKAIWRPAFEVENPGAQFELARSISRKTKMGEISLLAGATVGILASKPLLREYEKLALVLDN